MTRHALLLSAAWLAALGCHGGRAATVPARGAAGAPVGNDADHTMASACWPGQTYLLDAGHCSGTPTACPADRRIKDDTCWLRSDPHAVAVGDRVRRSADWNVDEDGDEDGGATGNGLGTVLDRTGDNGDMLEVRWDAGEAGFYRWGALGKYEVEVVEDAPPLVLLERARVVAGPGCKRCASGGGTVLAVGAGTYTIEWDRGRVQEGVVAGVAGVVPTGGYDVPIDIGARVKRGAAWKHAEEDRGGLGTVVGRRKGAPTVEVRWDYGRLGSYGWSRAELSELVVVDAPPPTVPLGFRVTPGPECPACLGDGVVAKVLSPLEVEVTWAAGGRATVPVGVAGVVPLGPAAPTLVVGSRVVRGPDWTQGDEDGGGPGLVVATLPGDRVMVHWDGGLRRTYRNGADATLELALSKAPPPVLAVGAKVTGAPACSACPRGRGEISKAAVKGKVEVRWGDGTTTTAAVGADGVLPVNDTFVDLQVGMSVRRGRDWKWGDQDTEDGGNGTGIVTGLDPDNDGWVTVDWVGGGSNSYRWGAEDAYDLEIIGG